MPLNPFDKLGQIVFDLTARVMGYDATWQPVAGGSYSARVHFKSPSNEEELAGFTYDQHMYICEWKNGDWPQLETKYKEGNERVTIDTKQYAVIHVRALFDGRTFQAVLKAI